MEVSDMFTRVEKGMTRPSLSKLKKACREGVCVSSFSLFFAFCADVCRRDLKTHQRQSVASESEINEYL